MTRTDIINTLIRRNNYKSYLEIGVQQGANFYEVQCAEKTGVDNDQLTLKFFPKCIISSSDDFFKSNTQKYDVVFIDGLHHGNQVYRDIINSLDILNEGGAIVCHDMLPKDESCQIVPREQVEWNGDCWKAWVRLRSERADLEMYVVDTDYGCGIIQPGHQETIRYTELTWPEFLKNREQWMNIIQPHIFLTMQNAMK